MICYQWEDLHVVVTAPDLFITLLHGGRAPPQNTFHNLSVPCRVRAFRGVICMVDFTASDRIVMMPCTGSHIFHRLENLCNALFEWRSCLAQWFRTAQTCPLCRSRLPGDEIPSMGRERLGMDVPS